MKTYVNIVMPNRLENERDLKARNAVRAHNLNTNNYARLYPHLEDVPMKAKDAGNWSNLYDYMNQHDIYYPGQQVRVSQDGFTWKDSYFLYTRTNNGPSKYAVMDPEDHAKWLKGEHVPVRTAKKIMPVECWNDFCEERKESNKTVRPKRLVLIYKEDSDHIKALIKEATVYQIRSGGKQISIVHESSPVASPSDVRTIVDLEEYCNKNKIFYKGQPIEYKLIKVGSWRKGFFVMKANYSTSLPFQVADIKDDFSWYNVQRVYDVRVPVLKNQHEQEIKDLFHKSELDNNEVIEALTLLKIRLAKLSYDDFALIQKILKDAPWT